MKAIKSQKLFQENISLFLREWNRYVDQTASVGAALVTASNHKFICICNNNGNPNSMFSNFSGQFLVNVIKILFKIIYFWW